MLTFLLKIRDEALYTSTKLFTLELPKAMGPYIFQAVNNRYFLLPASTYDEREEPILEVVREDERTVALETELLISAASNFLCKNGATAIYGDDEGEITLFDLTNVRTLRFEGAGQITHACDFIEKMPPLEAVCEGGGVKFIELLSADDGVLVGCSYGNQESKDDKLALPAEGKTRSLRMGYAGTEIKLVSPTGEVRWRQVVDDGNNLWSDRMRSYHIKYVPGIGGYVLQVRYNPRGHDNKYGMLNATGWIEPFRPLREGPWYAKNKYSGMPPFFEIYKAGEPTILYSRQAGISGGIWIIEEDDGAKVKETMVYPAVEPPILDEDGCGLVFLRSTISGESQKLPNGGWQTPRKVEAFQVRWCDG